MSHLPFEYIGDELAKIGVTMKVVAPKKVEFNIGIDGVAFGILQGEKIELDKYSEVEKKEIERRVSIAKDSFLKICHHFGPFTPGFNISEFIEKKKKIKGYL